MSSRRRRFTVLACISALAGCGLSVIGVDPLPVGVDAGPEASANLPPKSDGGTPETGSADVTVPPIDDAGADAVAPTVVFSASEDPDAGEVIRAVTASSGRIFFLDSAAKSIRQLDNGAATTLLPNVQGNQLIASDNSIWHTGVPGANDMYRYEIGSLDFPLGTGTLSGCAFVEPAKTKVYGADISGRILYVPYTGAGLPTVLLDKGDGGVDAPWGVAVTDTKIFYTRALTSIVSRDRNGDAIGTTETPIVTGQTNVNCLTIEGDHLYFPDFAQGTIQRVRLDGSEPRTLATGQFHPTQIGIASGFLYWGSGAKIMRLPLPQ